MEALVKETLLFQSCAMNPCDHAHGGGEGRSPIGRSRPVTPWGRPALGQKTRRPKRYSNIYIIRSRKSI